MPDQPIVIDTPDGIQMFHLLQLKYALKLELMGMKMSRGSAYAYIKKYFNLKGNKQSVYNQFCTLIESKKSLTLP